MNPLAILLVALVADDGVALRSAPDDGAPAQATLFRGDWLEVRAEVPGFLKVWDHRHERPGYVRPTSVRVYTADDGSADELRAVIRFVRSTPGLEALVRANSDSGHLQFSTDAASAIAHAQIIFIAVGTPPDEDGSADLSHVLDVARTIGATLARYTVVVNKSTVPVGTADKVRAAIVAE